MSQQSYCIHANKVYWFNEIYTPTIHGYGDDYVDGFMLFRRLGVVIDITQWHYSQVVHQISVIYESPNILQRCQ